jgi:trigger factor
VGETKSFVATFPEQYNSPKLAGKEATFDIEMVAIDAPQLPELDAAFIQTYGVESGDANDFRQDVQSNMERELVKGLKNRLKTAVLDVLYENVPITVPTTLVDQEIKNSMQPYAERAKKMGLKIEDLNLPADMFESQAKRRVALGLLLGEIIQKNSLTVDADKVRAVIDDMAKSYEKPEEVVNWYYADKTRLNDVQQMVLEDQAVEWVLSQTTVTDQTISFADVMESN